MSVQRIVTKVEVAWWIEPGGYAIQVDTRYVESTIGGGKVYTNVDRYELLTRDEAIDLMEMVARAPGPGAEYVLQESMFVLE